MNDQHGYSNFSTDRSTKSGTIIDEDDNMSQMTQKETEAFINELLTSSRRQAIEDTLDQLRATTSTDYLTIRYLEELLQK
mmetsp:Transcript_1975/g.2068  ORF Transcript_1975/g.2068 Transcript_1975/m.2068 type:complete len:80 (-) Transcript_1975:36-275(-)